MSNSKLKSVSGSEGSIRYQLNGKHRRSAKGHQGVHHSSAATYDPVIRDSYSDGNWNNDRPLQSIPWDRPREVIQMCMSAYHASGGIVGNVIDLMVDFSLEGLTIHHPKKSAQNFYKEWMSLVRLHTVTHNVFLDLFRAGNVPILRKVGAIGDEEKNKLFQGIASNIKTVPKGNSAFINSIPEFEQGQIPVQYITYNPSSLIVYGDEAVGSVNYEIEIDKNTAKAIRDKNAGNLINIDKNITIKSKRGQHTFEVDKKNFIHLAWRKPDYMSYGMPFISRILEELVLRRVFFRILRAAADGWLSAIRIWKLGKVVGSGSTPEIMLPEEGAFSKLSNILLSHDEGSILDLLWDFAIELEEHYPPAQEIFSSVPLDTINLLIKQGLGVPDVLIDGSATGGGFSTAFLAVKTLVERLEYARNLVIECWLEPEVKGIAKSLGFRNMPTVKFDSMSLRDENAILKLLLALRDRNLLSKEATLKAFEYDWPTEMSRLMQEEQDDTPATKNLGPFFQNQNKPKKPGANSGGGEGPGASRDQRGAPTGDTGPKEKKKKASPPGQSLGNNGSLKDLQSIANRMENVLKLQTDKLDELIQQDDLHQITPQDYVELNGGLIQTIAPKKLDSCVSKVIKQKIAKWREKNKGKRLTKKIRDKIESSAWAICQDSVNKE